MRKCVAKFLSNPPKFTVLTKPILHALPVMPRVQTDGSFGSMNHRKTSRTAVLYRDRKGQDTTQCITYFDHKDSMESEWCSILDGIRYAQKKGDGFIELENDCLGVVQCLTREYEPRAGRYIKYFSTIHRELRNFDYVGLRWIPREMNKADDIFKLE